MPTYEYKCRACGHVFEIIQKITEPPLKKCPKCKKPKAERQIIGGNFILKGSGWYSDGYSGGSNKEKSESSEKSEKSESSEKSDKKDTSASEKPADSKPAEKAADAKPAEKKDDTKKRKKAEKKG